MVKINTPPVRDTYETHKLVIFHEHLDTHQCFT